MRRDPRAVVLATDWTILRLFPPVRAAWAKTGEQAEVPITGANAQRVLFGAINVRTGHRMSPKTSPKRLRTMWKPAENRSGGPGTRTLMSFRTPVFKVGVRCYTQFHSFATACRT